MPWQGHVWIGEIPQSAEHVVEIFKKLGATEEELGLDEVDWTDEQDKKEWLWDVAHHIDNVSFSIEVGEDVIPVKICFKHEAERLRSMDESFEIGQDVIVGFPLTSRYSGAILDKDCEKGRPEPFEIDIPLTKEVLKQIRKKFNWIEADVYMWTQWF
jgi:hypothetical protein